MTYTSEELLYEYYEVIEREAASVQQAEQEDDKIEDKKLNETLDWAEIEERKELEQINKLQEKSNNPLDDPANQEWMKEQLLAEAKQEFGEDFSEDIDTDFSG